MPRHRKQGLKLEHRIVEGGRELLEQLARADGVESVIPATIYPTKTFSPLKLAYAYPTLSGAKLRLYSGSAVQEVFITGDGGKIAALVASLSSGKGDMNVAPLSSDMAQAPGQDA